MSDLEKYYQNLYEKAWLHDVVEDTDISLAEITDMLWYAEDRGDDIVLIVDAVDCLTKKGEPNEDYYWRIKGNALATAVKIADIHDNFGRNHLIEDEETKIRMATKYSLGISILCRQT